MREKKYHLYLEESELRLLIYCLNEFRNRLIVEGRYTDCVDELLIKAANAKRVKLKLKLHNGGNINGKICV